MQSGVSFSCQLGPRRVRKICPGLKYPKALSASRALRTPTSPPPGTFRDVPGAGGEGRGPMTKLGLYTRGEVRPCFFTHSDALQGEPTPPPGSTAQAQLNPRETNWRLWEDRVEERLAAHPRHGLGSFSLFHHPTGTLAAQGDLGQQHGGERSPPVTSEPQGICNSTSAARQGPEGASGSGQHAVGEPARPRVPRGRSPEPPTAVLPGRPLSSVSAAATALPAAVREQAEPGAPGLRQTGHEFRP